MPFQDMVAAELDKPVLEMQGMDSLGTEADRDTVEQVGQGTVLKAAQDNEVKAAQDTVLEAAQDMELEAAQDTDPDRNPQLDSSDMDKPS
jgi:hypothetical protein